MYYRSMQQKYSDNVQLFVDKIKTNSYKQNLNVNIDLIEVAISYIKQYHEGQTRHSGELYFNHPLEVANILIDYLLDTNSIIAALLHDVVEDTCSSLKQIEFIFNKEIADIVCTISKITKQYQLSKIETFDKINHCQDQEKKAILIKVIDRLHNMRTIHHIRSIEKQHRIANETLQFYIPWARAINFVEIEHELKLLATNVLNLKP